MFKTIAGTIPKSDITIGNKKVEKMNIFERTRARYSRLTTARNFFMQIPSLS